MDTYTRAPSIHLTRFTALVLLACKGCVRSSDRRSDLPGYEGCALELVVAEGKHQSKKRRSYCFDEDIHEYH